MTARKAETLKLKTLVMIGLCCLGGKAVAAPPTDYSEREIRMLVQSHALRTDVCSGKLKSSNSREAACQDAKASAEKLTALGWHQQTSRTAFGTTRLWCKNDKASVCYDF